jgi:hypothetical protein
MCNIDATKIQPSDRLCLLCYKHHLSIISHLNDQSVSYDSSLLEDITSWSYTKNDTETDLLTKAILETVIFVAQRLFENKALLLSTACIAFLEKYSDESHETEINSVSDVSIEIAIGNSAIKFTSRWLLRQLTLHLHRYMESKCIHKKFGTALCRKDGDLLISLSWALGQCGAKQQAGPCQKQSPTIDTHQLLELSGKEVNRLLHKEIGHLSSPPSNMDPSDFSIDGFLSNVDPQLIHFLTTATRASIEKKMCRISSHIPSMFDSFFCYAFS